MQVIANAIFVCASSDFQRENAATRPVFTGKMRVFHRRKSRSPYCFLHGAIYFSPSKQVVFIGKNALASRNQPQPFHLPGERMAAKKGGKKAAKKGGAKKGGAKKGGAKKGGAKKSSAKKAAKKSGAKRTPNAAFMRPMQPDPALAA